MRRSIALIIVLAALVVAAGCNKKQSADPQTRVRAEVDQYGPAEALARANDRVKADPTAENYLLLATLYGEGAKKQRELRKPAREALDKAVSLDPAYAPASLLLARTLMEEGKSEQAQALVQRVLQKNPQNVRGIELQARLLMKLGRCAEAEPLLAAALKRHPRDADLQWAYGDALTILSRFDEADKAYLQAIKADPKNVNIRLAYMQMLLFARRYDQVPPQAREVAKLGPDSAEMQFAAASALHQVGKEDEALSLYREALIIDPGNVPAANNIALLLADRAQDTGTAVAWARKAALAAPKSPEVMDTLGWALVRDGNYPEGLAVLQGVHKARPGDPIIQYHLGWALAKTGRKAEGMALLQQAAAGERPDAAKLAKQAIAEFS